MADILHKIEIAAPRDRVYEAWTTSEGLASWWTADSVAAREVGAINEFGFLGGATRFYFRVDPHEPGRRVRWTGVDGENMSDEWIGTEIHVDLDDSEGGGTLVTFGHLGWRSIDGAYAYCNTTWGELMYRLKDACEGPGRGPLFKG